MSRGTATDLGPCFEWTAFEAGLPPAKTLKIRPGMVIRDGSGRAVALHPAPAQWLLPQPVESWLTELHAAQAQGRGVLTDVTGRWRVVHTPASTPTAARFIVPHPLAAAMPLELYLRDREVAALWVFDCPVLVLRQGTGIDVWVEASYEAGLRAAGV